MRLAQQHGHLQQRRTARAVVVDAGPLEYRVQVRAGHDHVVRIAATGLGHQVEGLGLLADHVHHHAQLQPGGLRPGHAVVIGGELHRDAALVGLAQGDVLQALAVLGVALVEDDHANRTGGRGVLRLHLEVAATALDEGDRTAGEAGKILHFAAAGGGVAGPQGQVHRRHRGADITRIGLRQVVEILLPDIADRLWHQRLQGTRPLGEERGEGERLHPHLVAGAFQGLLHVIDGGVVARQAGGAVAVVEGGDVLQLLQAGHHIARLQTARQAQRCADQNRRLADGGVGFARAPELAEGIAFSGRGGERGSGSG
ncbi:hypothetical protein FQZ97_564710 [compost metagenome]